MTGKERERTSEIYEMIEEDREGKSERDDERERGV